MIYFIRMQGISNLSEVLGDFSIAKPNSARRFLPFSEPGQEEKLVDGFEKLVNNFHKQFLLRSEARKIQLNDNNSNKLEIYRKFWKDEETLQDDQELLLKSVQNLRKKIEIDQNEETKELCLEIYSYCCMHPFGLLDPVIGLSDTSLQWYKIFQNKVSEMNSLNQFLGTEREQANIGNILPSKIFNLCLIVQILLFK